MAHALSILDRSNNVFLRMSVLALCKALIMPIAGEMNPAAALDAKENGAHFIEAGGIQLLADMIAGGDPFTAIFPHERSS